VLNLSSNAGLFLGASPASIVLILCIVSHSLAGAAHTYSAIDPSIFVIVISPGPCTPKEAGISVDIVKEFSGKKPILGVCLGHQSIGDAFGADIVRAERLVHGKTSEIFHNSTGIFKDIPNPFEATRYHSLIIDKETLSDDFEITAWTKEDEIMGIRHKTLLIEGVQFHPESVLTIYGKDILNNFLKLAKAG